MDEEHVAVRFHKEQRREVGDIGTAIGDVIMAGCFGEEEEEEGLKLALLMAY